MIPAELVVRGAYAWFNREVAERQSLNSVVKFEYSVPCVPGDPVDEVVCYIVP